MSSVAVMAGDFCNKHEFTHDGIDNEANIYGDGDYDEYRAGFIYQGESLYTGNFIFDTCLDDSTIYEGVCDSGLNYHRVSIDCPGGCVEVAGSAVCEYFTEEEEEEAREAWEVAAPNKICDNGVDDDYSGTIDYDNGNGGWCDVDRDGLVGEKSAYSFAKERYVDENDISEVECESDFAYEGVVDLDDSGSVSLTAEREPGFFGRIFGRFFVDVTGYAAAENVRSFGGGNLQEVSTEEDAAEEVEEEEDSNVGTVSGIAIRDYTTCVDSDGGKDYYTRGIASGTTYAGGILTDVEDTCDGAKVHERYCSSSDVLSSIYKHCTFGCSNGACVDATFDLETGEVLTEDEAESAMPETTVALADLDLDASCSQSEIREGYTCVCTWVEDEEVEDFEIEQQVAFETELIGDVESGDFGGFTRPDREMGDSGETLDFERSRSAKWYPFDHDCTSRNADEFGFSDMDTTLDNVVVDVEDEDGNVLGTATVEVYVPSDQEYSEVVLPECNDGVDNDGDSKIDYEAPSFLFEADGGCDSIYDDSESHMGIASNSLGDSDEEQDRIAALDNDDEELELRDDQVDEVGFIGRLFGRG